MFEPDRNMPDEYGFFYHPDLPVADEGESIAPPMAALGYECAFVCFDDDADDERVEAYNEGDPCVKAWAPTVPDGDGWILVAKYGTEDGPYAMFARKSRQSSDLWAIHIPGPDEYHAAPSEDAANQMAKRHNDAMAEYLAKHPLTEAAPSMASITATSVPWPFDAESHAEELATFDYAAWGIEQKPEGGDK